MGGSKGGDSGRTMKLSDGQFEGRHFACRSLNVCRLPMRVIV